MNSEVKGHILVVDDQDNWRSALVDLLMKEGYATEEAARFEEAKTAIMQKTFDLVILDVRLADKNVFNVEGLELLKLVKAQKPRPKAIVLTGYPESIRDGVLERYGADLLVLKVPPGSKFDSRGFIQQIGTLMTQAGNE